jgi:hypothetical protein
METVIVWYNTRQDNFHFADSSDNCVFSGQWKRICSMSSVDAALAVENYYKSRRSKKCLFEVHRLVVANKKPDFNLRKKNNLDPVGFFSSFIKIPRIFKVIDSFSVPFDRVESLPNRGFFVYFLYKDTPEPLNERVVYIGKSYRVNTRINSHKKRFDFDYVIAFEFIDEPTMDAAESSLISMHRPRYNIVDNPDHKYYHRYRKVVLDGKVDCPQSLSKVDCYKCEACKFNKGWTTHAGIVAMRCSYITSQN